MTAWAKGVDVVAVEAQSAFDLAVKIKNTIRPLFREECAIEVVVVNTNNPEWFAALVFYGEPFDSAQALVRRWREKTDGKAVPTETEERIWDNADDARDREYDRSGE